MHIVPQSPIRGIEEHDKILRRHLAARAPEWQSKTGVNRLITRIRVEFWAWGQMCRWKPRSRYRKIHRRFLAMGASEWRGRTGIRRIVARIKVEIWAWRQTWRRRPRSRRFNSEPYKLY